MASEPRACPMTPEELREIGRWIEHYAEHSWLLYYERAKRENVKLRELADWLATPAAAPRVLTREQVMQALGRGWCHPDNQRKEVDVVLAEAMTDEIMRLLEGA